MLTLEQQLSVICDELANGTVARFLSEGQGDNHSPQFLPFEKATIVLNRIKLLTDVVAEVQCFLGKEEAKRFYTKPYNVIQGTNRGGLGWSSKQFYSVAWTALDATLKSKPSFGSQNNASVSAPQGLTWHTCTIYLTISAGTVSNQWKRVSI
jgi:hypothetical protein